MLEIRVTFLGAKYDMKGVLPGPMALAIGTDGPLGRCAIEQPMARVMGRWPWLFERIGVEDRCRCKLTGLKLHTTTGNV